jgi:glutamyl-tRNA reductase
MAIVTLGVNHRTASVNLRERLTIGPDRLPTALAELQTGLSLSEVAILSTCNRTEIYCDLPQLNAKPVIEWLGHYQEMSSREIADHAYVHHDEAAVRHMLRVASGLDSLVLGEPQILGQLKSAYAMAREVQTLGPHLGKLFQHTFRVAKVVRTETEIGANPVSVAYASVDLARNIFTNVANSKVLLIGAGETIELVAQHFRGLGVSQITVANRTYERAERLANRTNGQAILLQDIPSVLHQADIVVSSTASPLPILGKGMMEAAVKQRKHKPVLVVDLAVPRDVEPAVGDMSDIFLYTVDDLESVVAQNRQQRQSAAQAAEAIVTTQAADFMRLLRERDAVETLRRYREKMDNMRRAEEQRALRALARGDDPAAVLAKFGRSLMNKVTHDPTVRLREAAADARYDWLAWSEKLLGLTDPEAELGSTEDAQDEGKATHTPVKGQKASVESITDPVWKPSSTSKQQPK